MSVALLDQGDTVPERGRASSIAPAGSVAGASRPVAQQRAEHRALRGVERPGDVDKMQESRVDSSNSKAPSAERVLELGEPECGMRRRAGDCQHYLLRDPGSPGVYTGYGNCVTLEPSAVETLLTPDLRTSSMRMTECSGR